MIKILLYTTVVGFILGQLTRINFGNGIAVTLLDISVFTLVSYWLLLKVVRREKLQAKLLHPIALFAVGCLLSLALNSFTLQVGQLGVASLYLVRWLFYAGVYFVICDMSNHDKKQIPALLIIAGVAHVIIGFFQYFFYPDLSDLYHLGWDEHLYRMFGSFLDPNYQGSLYVLLFIFVMIISMRLPEKEKGKRYSYYFFLVFILIAIVLTYSRSALVMLFVSMVGYAFTSGRKKLVALIVVATLFFVIIFSNIYIEGLNPLRTASSSARISSMSEAVAIIQKNPIFGVGFNAYRYAQNRYGFRTSDFWMVSHADSGTDNSYLFIFATTGTIGFLAFLYLLKKMFDTTALGKNNDSLRTIVRISLIGLMVNSLFINSMFYTFLMYWLWVLLGIRENTKT